MPPTITPITFVRVTREDIALLHDWLARPHVAEWWGEADSLEELEEEYALGRVDDTRLQPFIAYLHGQPIGFIQSYVAFNAGDGWWPEETDPGVRGIDQFLAESSQLNQGLGTAMVRAFVARLFADPAVTRVQTDPRPTNLRAIRCYEKAGFRRVGEVETPDGTALLLVCERAIGSPEDTSVSLDMSDVDDRQLERERIIQEICAQLPTELSEIVGDALRSGRGVTLGTSDPSTNDLFARLQKLSEALELPET